MRRIDLFRELPVEDVARILVEMEDKVVSGKSVITYFDCDFQPHYDYDEAVSANITMLEGECEESGCLLDISMSAYKFQKELEAERKAAEEAWNALLPF